jgi:hypothetical protein
VRFVGVGSVAVIAATLTSGPARARKTTELESDCRTVVSGDPSSKALAAVLARIGSEGKTRLDLTVRDEEDRPHENGEAHPPPRLVASREWKKPADAARAIAGAKTMASAKELVLDRFPITVETARILAASPNLRNIEVLVIRRTGVTAPALRELFAPGALPALVELDLTNNGLKAADLQELAARLLERKVKRLALGVDRGPLPDYLKTALATDAATREALARVAATPSLTNLVLNDEPIGFATLQALLETGRKQPLDVETSGFPKLSAKQLATVAALDAAGHVTFSISSLEIDPGRLRAFDKSGFLAKLSSLEVNCGDACARILAGSSHTERLREISFSCGGGETDYPFTKATAIALARSTRLPALRRLLLFNDVEICQAEGIGDAGLRALLKAPFAGQLESLTLHYQNLDDAGYVALAKATSLGALKELDASEYEYILTPATAPALLRDGALARHLEVLRLQTEGNLEPKLLAKGIKMPKLRVLELPAVSGSMPDLMRVARAPGWGNVRVLSLSGQVDDDDRPIDPFLKELRKHLPADVCLP